MQDKFRESLPKLSHLSVIIEDMAKIREQLVVPDGLMIANLENFEEKVKEFATLGAAGMHAVFDFDRTLTVKKPGTQDEVTS